MRILFVSEDLVAGDLARELLKEGNEVKLYIADSGRRHNLEGLVPKTDDWRQELKWVGQDGLIVFDGCRFGTEQNRLRKLGFSVVGSSEYGNKLENDRAFGDAIFKKYGLKTVPLLDFSSLDDAISFVRANPRPWVIKQNSSGTSLKSFNYVGLLSDGSDVIDVLENYKTETKYEDGLITLQERIDGVEIGVGRYFNGHEWVGPIEINLEHKKFFPGDLGPTTSEMGTLAWYDDDEENRLFREVLAPLKPYLQEIDFRGDMEVNCIVNQKGAFPLEATARFGSPIIHLQTEIQTSPWTPFLQALAAGKKYHVRWHRGFGIVVVVTVPTSQPFPFTKAERYVSPRNITVYLNEVSDSEFQHIHFEDVSFDARQKRYYISDDRGYVLYVTAVAQTVAAARDKVYRLLEKIHIPKMFYRNDIGLKFIEGDEAKLRRWGYLK